MDITKIYLVTNCYGDPNKVYIGKEKLNKGKYNSRKYDHKKTYGDNIIFTYIDEINSLDKEDWKPLECFWINYFKFLGFDVQNKNEGGGGPTFNSKETIKKISKKIIQYDLEGNFIRELNSLKEATNLLKINSSAEISRCCRGNKRQVRGFIFRFKDNNKVENILIPKPPQHSKRPVIQYDLEGNIIKCWDSITEASIFMCGHFSSSISSVCNKKTKTAHGYKWSWKI